MRILPFQTLKTQGSKSIPDHEAAYLIVNSQAKSVLVPPEEYESLLRAREELEDLKAISDRRDEPTISFEKAFA